MLLIKSWVLAWLDVSVILFFEQKKKKNSIHYGQLAQVQ